MRNFPLGLESLNIFKILLDFFLGDSQVSSKISHFQILEKTIQRGLHSNVEWGGILINHLGKIIAVDTNFLKLTDQNEDEIVGRFLSDFIEKANVSKYFLGQIEALSLETVPYTLFECLWSINSKKSIKLSFQIYPPLPGSPEFGCFIKKCKSTKTTGNLLTLKYLEKILGTINAIIWLRSADAKESYYMSPNFERIFGFSTEKFNKDPNILFERMHPEDRDHVRQVFRNSVEDIGYRYLRADGQWRHFTAYRFFIYDQDNNPSTVAGVAIDDTKLYTAQQRLEHKKNELKKQNEELAKTNHFIENFTAFLCHDLARPLRVFSTYTQILEDKYHQNSDNRVSDDQVAPLFLGIHKNIKRMKDLLQGVAELSLIQTSWCKHHEICDVKSTLEDEIEPLFNNLMDSCVTIEKGKLCPLHVNKVHLTVLLKNLIENGIKYNTNIPHIKITSKKFKTGTVYTIKDNGIGIPKDDQESIFLFGNRLQTTSATYEGTGIGLAACEKIMSLYQGKIWVHSLPEKGSTFYLFFPD